MVDEKDKRKADEDKRKASDQSGERRKDPPPVEKPVDGVPVVRLG